MNMTQEIKAGSIVRILSGRGESRAALVIEMTEDGRARIADGRRIRIEKAKVKSCKHLQAIGSIPQGDGADLTKKSNRAIWAIITQAACGIIERRDCSVKG